jgi:Repeat of Unknown Function (DUF347)
MGTALGDLTASTFGLGYLASGLLFAAVIAIPAVGYWRLGWNAIFSFWFAYVATRPLGASFADWMSKPKSVGGLGWGDGPVALALTIIIFCFVAYLAITRRDVQSASTHHTFAMKHVRESSPPRKASIDRLEDTMSTEGVAARSRHGVWEGRIQSARHGFPGGPGASEPGLFSPSGNGAPSRRPH